MKKEKQIIESLLEAAGIVINGSNAPDPQIHNEDFYKRVLRQGSLGLGESYMDGWWDCGKLDQFFDKVLSANLDSRVKNDLGIALKIVFNYALNVGRKSKAFEIGKKHYDIGNDLFRAMLDKRLTYTCGYWENAGNLADAQEAKLDLVCKKIGLKSGQKILDIGSGWGSFMGYAAEKYGVSAFGVTVSKEQKELADKVYKNFSIETKLQDYRSINGKFDHIVSLGMFEHVGVKHYKEYMKVIHRCLNDGGIFLLHTIGCDESGKIWDPWFDKYIFPGGKLPSIQQIGKSIEGLFVMEDWHNFGADYDKTLMAWYNNFEENWDKIKLNYDEKFYRMWRYYLLACAGSFRARKNQLWQIVLSKTGVSGGYRAIR
ncbi:cyclopropane fatty acyl phospholipid synthase [Candidatus Wolfebacteria bacterium]|nr:cyclopropane fatty acyl phospholipid synthase [Candidatus Wolfebacteria bacterium]